MTSRPKGFQQTDHMETALRLSTRERIGTLIYFCMPHFFTRRFEEAGSKFLMDIQIRPGRPRSYQYLAACYGPMGRIDEARAIIARLRAIAPLVVPDESPLGNPEHSELLLSGLRLALGEAE